MDLLRWTIALLIVSAVAVLLGGMLWNLGERRVRLGDQRPELQGMVRLGKFLCVDAGLVLVASIVFFALYQLQKAG